MRFPPVLQYVTSVSLLLLLVIGIHSPIPETRNYETIRNIYFHVPMWFGMMVFLTASFWYSIRHLRFYKPQDDYVAVSMANVGMLYGILGLITGMVWASSSWGSAWNNDPKQVGATVALLTYIAYMILRRSISNAEQRARIAAVYNLFAYFLLYPTIWILPRLSESLHPGGLHDEEVAFNADNLDLTMRLIMWLLAVPTWILLGWWISSIQYRIHCLRHQMEAINLSSSTTHHKI